MARYPYEALFWAPNPYNNLASGMYATEKDEINETKDEIIFGLINGEYAPQPTFLDLMEVIFNIFPISKKFNSKDWNDIRRAWE